MGRGAGKRGILQNGKLINQLFFFYSHTVDLSRDARLHKRPSRMGGVLLQGTPYPARLVAVVSCGTHG
jgi:hypothetical protein